MPLFVVLFYMLPDSAPLLKRFGETRYLKAFVWGYHQWYWLTKDQVIVWHREELKKLDWDFQFQEASSQLLAARRKAHESGMSAGSPDYPTLRDFLPPDLPSSRKR